MGSILQRKVITKSTLFKYLHGRRVPVNAELSKLALIEKTIEHWTATFRQTDADEDSTNDANAEQSEGGASTTADDNGSGAIVVHETPNDTHEQFPIHRMSRLFTGWFFKQYNDAELSADDFWCDAQCTVEMRDAAQPHESENTESAQGADSCVAMLLALRAKYAFYFNANESHGGCQGRIDAHGLVLVLSCGTLHVDRSRVVGCWECAFGLVRDPFADNNWKVKHMRLRLRSAAPNAVEERPPELDDCETLQGMLALPASDMDLT